MNKNTTTKPKNVDFYQVPDQLWQVFEQLLPAAPERIGPGRPRVSDRAVLNGIWYVLWTGCQWKAVHRNWFGVSSSVLHERFQTWQKQGLFDKLMQAMAAMYQTEQTIGWEWQSIDSKMVPAPLGGQVTGRNPTDRGKQGAPLALTITGANQHDKWPAGDLLVSLVVDRPDPEQTTQHLCADKGYDYEDVHQVVAQEHYIAHIKHRRRGQVCPLALWQLDKITAPSQPSIAATFCLPNMSLQPTAK